MGAGAAGQQYCGLPGDYQCCDNCLTNQDDDSICCNIGESLCNGPGSESYYCCPPEDYCYYPPETPGFNLECRTKK